jgi:hypothetical protein
MSDLLGARAAARPCNFDHLQIVDAAIPIIFAARFMLPQKAYTRSAAERRSVEYMPGMLAIAEGKNCEPGCQPFHFMLA